MSYLEGYLMLTWLQIVGYIYRVIEFTIEYLKISDKINEITRKKYSIVEIKDDLSSNELHFGDRITVLGTFSEYLPFIDIKNLIHNEFENLSNSFHTTRIEPINDFYCGSLFTLHSKDAFSNRSMPIFYDRASRMLEHRTGDMLEMSCKITQIPKSYQNLLLENESFSYERDDGIEIPFGLEVLDVKPFDESDSFLINSWALGSLDPFPTPLEERKGCLNCVNSFSFMQIEPIDWPLRAGCLVRDSYDSSFTNESLLNTENFLTLDSRGLPYIIFPKTYSNFELFYPKIDIYDSEQIRLSHDLFLGAINENIELLFSYVIYSKVLNIPEKFEVNLDYQYDQRNKITTQTFNPENIPKWTCPDFSPIPDININDK